MATTRELWQRADRILEQALDLGPAEREALIESACAGDEALRELVGRLLDNLEEDEEASPLDPEGGMGAAVSSWIASGLTAPTEPAAGSLVAGYRLVSELGRGGMSIVYLAHREGADFRQAVALKLIQGRVAGEEAERRFARERQILADLRHPDIARLLDGGTTAEGDQFLVMELVDGVPIDRYCAERRLGVAERVRLFLRVARAVAAAHRNLVVHRDIKPSNVLVTAEGDVKLLDFGIAKLLGEQAEAEHLTRTGALPMTPAFAAPEQVRGEAVTTATDVYQLGVLLYLLLTGASPHGNHGSDALGFVRAVVEHQPPRLWEACAGSDPASAADGFGTAPAALRASLGGDLEAVVFRALAKRPADRYGAVEGLVEDLERVLDGRPVSARPLTTVYRARLFVRRHAGLVAAAGALLVALVGWTATTAVQNRRIAAEVERANREARSAERVADFLARLFNEADPNTARGAEVTVREVLERGRGRLSSELAEEPAVRATLAHTIASVYFEMGLYDDADELYREAVELRTRALGAEHPETLKSRHALATTASDLGRYEASRQQFLDVLEASRRVLGPEDPVTMGALNNLALLESRLGHDERALELLEEHLEIRRRVRGPEHHETLRAAMNVATTLWQLGRMDEALALAHEARQTGLRTLGDDHPWVLEAAVNEAGILRERGELEAAAELFEGALPGLERVLGASHPSTLTALGGISNIHMAGGRHAEALEIRRRVLEGTAARLGPDHPETVRRQREVADLMQLTGRLEEARAVYETLLAAMERAPARHVENLRYTLYNLACLEVRTGRPAAALDALERAAAAGMLAPSVGSDPDLAPLHGHPRFTAVAARLAAGAAPAPAGVASP